MVVNKIKPTITIRTKVGLIFSETESIKCASMAFANLNGYEILIAQPIDK